MYANGRKYFLIPYFDQLFWLQLLVLSSRFLFIISGCLIRHHQVECILHSRGKRAVEIMTQKGFHGNLFLSLQNRLHCLLCRGGTILTLLPFSERFFPLARVLLFPICILLHFKRLYITAKSEI